MLEARAQILDSPTRKLARFDLEHGFSGGLSLRLAGDMRAVEERKSFVAALGLPDQRLVAVRQVHSQRVVVATESLEPGGRSAVAADGIVSNAPSDVLLVTVADCLPVYLAGADGAFGLVHSGWRGTGIVSKALELMASRYGTAPVSVTATIGPGIGACCYNVDDERARLFTDRYGPGAVRVAAGGPYLDLVAVNETILREAGVGAVRSVDLCTSCTPHLWSSRRDGGGGACRLMAAVIARWP